MAMNEEQYNEWVEQGLDPEKELALFEEDNMSEEDYYKAVIYLRDKYVETLPCGEDYSETYIRPFRLPYGLLPGSFSEDREVYIMNSRQLWEPYEWNPPQFSGFTEHEEGASSKPDWNFLKELSKLAARDELREELIEKARDECKRRIIRSYGADSWEDEIQIRLGSNRDKMSRFDAAREALRFRCRQLKAVINSAKIEELREIDVLASTHWVSPADS